MAVIDDRTNVEPELVVRALRELDVLIDRSVLRVAGRTEIDHLRAALGISDKPSTV